MPERNEQLDALMERLRVHETTTLDDDGKYVVDVDAVTGYDPLAEPHINLVALTDESRERLRAAERAQEGHYEAVVLEHERSILVFNRWYGSKLRGATPVEVEDAAADDDEKVVDMFSVFRRPLRDDDDARARAPPEQLEQTAFFGIVDSDSFEWLVSLGSAAGVVQLRYCGDATTRSGVVALQIEFKRERGGQLEPVSVSQFKKCVERARSSAARIGDRWRRSCVK